MTSSITTVEKVQIGASALVTVLNLLLIASGQGSFYSIFALLCSCVVLVVTVLLVRSRRSYAAGLPSSESRGPAMQVSWWKTILCVVVAIGGMMMTCVALILVFSTLLDAAPTHLRGTAWFIAGFGVLIAALSMMQYFRMVRGHVHG